METDVPLLQGDKKGRGDVSCWAHFRKPQKFLQTLIQIILQHDEEIWSLCSGDLSGCEQDCNRLASASLSIDGWHADSTFVAQHRDTELFKVGASHWLTWQLSSLGTWYDDVACRLHGFFHPLNEAWCVLGNIVTNLVKSRIRHRSCPAFPSLASTVERVDKICDFLKIAKHSGQAIVCGLDSWVSQQISCCPYVRKTGTTRWRYRSLWGPRRLQDACSVDMQSGLPLPPPLFSACFPCVWTV